MGIENSNFIEACYGRNKGTIPVWIMRQAGRYLPEYLAVREKTSFVELCRSPELIAEVVRQPVERFGLDTAILFSDILTILDPMGAEVSFPEGGPTPEAVDSLTDFDIQAQLPFVFEGIKRIKETLPETPLIGFAGSPFTIACYLIEGQGSKNFDKAKQFIHRHPEAAERLFDLLVNVISRYLEAQINAGVDAVQLFDSWGGILSKTDYRKWSAEPNQRIFAHIKNMNVPRILFVNNLAPYLDIVREIDCEVIGVDYRMDLAQAERELPGKSIQGNLDPAVMHGPVEIVRQQTREILDSINNHDRLIFNLGHGIQPKTPIASVEAIVSTVHSYR